ncbi:MAG: TerB family tellurite resistance protein [Crocinitomicaceae bacterium]|nr:TerB family tellurite resistance protein [Crocinitomicaceae bacterium]
MGYGKWIAGALGWAIGGPIGGLMGFAFGAMVDDSNANSTKEKKSRGYDPRNDRRYQSQRHHTRPGDFASALLVLSAAVMKADGRQMKSELDFIRQFLSKQMGREAATEQISLLGELLKKEIPLNEVCGQIRYYMEHPMRLQLLHYLFGIAKADGKVDVSEVKVIDRIAYLLGISEKDAESIRAMFYKDTAAAYTILEIDANASDDEVKKAYRKMVVKYHPDKVRDLGEIHQKAAQEKFIKVQEAYEHIKKERGIK